MNNRERVIASLEHRQPDRTPYCVHFTRDAHRKMVEFYGDPDFERKLGNCFTSGMVGKSMMEIEPDIFEDEFGVQWNRTVDKDIGVVRNTQVTLDTIDSYQFPDPLDVGAFQQLDALTSLADDSFVCSGFGFSLFERAWTLAGMEDILVWMVSEPERLHRLLDRILDHNLTRIKKICSRPQ